MKVLAGTARLKLIETLEGPRLSPPPRRTAWPQWVGPALQAA